MNCVALNLCPDWRQHAGGSVDLLGASQRPATRLFPLGMRLVVQ